MRLPGRSPGANVQPFSMGMGNPVRTPDPRRLSVGGPVSQKGRGEGREYGPARNAVTRRLAGRQTRHE